MVFFRNVQLRWMPLKGDRALTLALERPGASGDQGVYADRVALSNITPRFPAPDFSASYKVTQKWGYVRAAGMLRRIKWDDNLNDQFDLSGSATGWGINLSSNLNVTKQDVVRLQFVFGEGIQNYMPVDGVASARASRVRLLLDGGSPESSGIQACGRARFRAGRRARSLELRLQFEAPHTTIPPTPRSVHGRRAH